MLKVDGSHSGYRCLRTASNVTHPPVLISLIVTQGQEVQLNHRAVLMTEELVLPSLSGLPVKLGVNMTSLLSLRLKGNVNYRDASHFSLTGYIKPRYRTATATLAYKLCPEERNRCLSSQCLCGALCQDGGGRCFGPGYSGLAR